MIDFCLSLSPLLLSLFYKKIGSVSVYKSIAMATKAASKHLHTQLSPFLRHLGLAALPPVPKHSYSVVYLQTLACTHGEKIVENMIKKIHAKWTKFVSLVLLFLKEMFSNIVLY